MLAAQQAQPRDYHVLPPQREEAAPHGASATNPRGASPSMQLPWVELKKF
ncbi:unnamed protein product [Symbiodinium sp. CCMP2592]|nr:unnamed protein product [Symbiodinium sp. CCMP2592]